MRYELLIPPEQPRIQNRESSRGFNSCEQQSTNRLSYLNDMWKVDICDQKTSAHRNTSSLLVGTEERGRAGNFDDFEGPALGIWCADKLVICAVGHLPLQAADQKKSQMNMWGRKIDGTNMSDSKIKMMDFPVQAAGGSVVRSILCSPFLLQFASACCFCILLLTYPIWGRKMSTSWLCRSLPVPSLGLAIWECLACANLWQKPD